MPSIKILILSKKDTNYPSLYRAVLPEGRNMPSRTGQVMSSRPFIVSDQEVFAEIHSDCYQLSRSSIYRSHYLDTQAIVIWTDLNEDSPYFIEQKIEQLQNDLKPVWPIDEEIPFCEAKVFILPFHGYIQNGIMTPQEIQQTLSRKLNEPGFERVRALNWRVLEPINSYDEEALRTRFQFVLEQCLGPNHAPSMQQANLPTTFRRLSNAGVSAWQSFTGHFKANP